MAAQREKRKKSPEKSFTETDRYTIKLPDGRRDLVIEDTLASVESEFVRTLTRIRRRDRLPMSDKARLCLFASASRTTGSAHAASLFFTKFTRLLTSYRRISAGLNGFSRSQTASIFWKPGSSP